MPDYYPSPREPDPRRMREIVTRIGGAGRNRQARLYIDGEPWAIVQWGGPGRWCIEDGQCRCHEHLDAAAEQLRGGTLETAIALATAMIRDGRMPSPEEAERLAEEQRQKKRQEREAWDPTRLYETLAETLELWTERDPDFTRSNSYRRLVDELIAISEAAIDHFETVRDTALSELRRIEAGEQPSWYGDADTEAARAQFAYAEEHLARARQIVGQYAPERALPPAADHNAEELLAEARAIRATREARRQREAARDPDGAKRRRKRAMGRWRKNAGVVQHLASLMSEDEMAWFATAERTSDNALRLQGLCDSLWEREMAQHRGQRQAADARIADARARAMIAMRSEL
ncbi:MAG TPA: hypothetical protein VMF62_19795 [Acetobacteraceae bacterium]|nr:hypothetical protein [Acetobacteraceae bacterium]